MKQCNTCGVKKPLSDFYKRTEDGRKYMALCKPCANARTRKNYRETKLSKEGHARQIFQKRKRQAKKYGIPFSIDFKYVFSLQNDVCNVFHTPLNWCEMTRHPKTDTPSLDKIVPELGYVEGNVAWVSYRANTIKNNGTLEEHIAITKYIKSALKYLKKYS